MGLSNLVKEQVKKQVDAYKEKKETSLQRQKEYAQQTHLFINFTSGTQKIQCPPGCMIHQNPDGTVHFGYNTVNTYKLISYEWNGPQFNTITNSSTNGTEIKKGKAGKIGVGAALGSMVNPAGALVGAAMGAGSKGRKDIHSNTTSISTQKEIPTPAVLKVQNTSTGEIIGLTFNCTSLLDAKIKAFTFDSEFSSSKTEEEPQLLEKQNIPQANTSYDELAKLKKLLDMGVITQEDFDIKKKQLLGI